MKTRISPLSRVDVFTGTMCGRAWGDDVVTFLQGKVGRGKEAVGSLELVVF